MQSESPRRSEATETFHHPRGQFETILSESPRRSEATETFLLSQLIRGARARPNHPAAPRRLKLFTLALSEIASVESESPRRSEATETKRAAADQADPVPSESPRRSEATETRVHFPSSAARASSESPRRSEATETKSGEGPRRHQLQQSESPRRSEATETQFAAFFARLMVCGPNHPAAPRRLKPETTEFSVALALSSESPRRSEATETFGPDAVEEAAGAVRITPPLRGD